jgi:PAS domain S-box-containing protein
VKKRAASARFECCIQHKAGHPVWVNVALSPLWAEAVGERCHYVMVVEDVTAMKRTGEAYKNEVLYNEAVIEHTSAFIVAVDREGRFMSLNGAFLTMMGYKKSEVLGKTPWELGMMDEKETVRSQARFAALLEGSPPPPVEVKLRDRWGGLHDVELRSALIPGGVGGVDRIVVTGTDFTERNRLQQDILEIVETEQARLGHDLHDGVGQTMTGVVALMNALEADLSGRQKEDARRIRELLQQSVMEVRRMSHGLSPTSIAYRGLHGGLELLAEMVRTNFRTECVTELDASIRVEDQKKQANLYRICQEALNNAIRHGDPQTVWVRLRRLEEGGGRCVLEVVDDGRGILVSKRAKPSGIGLRVMEYRAGLIGARFSLKSRRGKGVTVSCEFTEDAVGSGG